MSEQDKNKPNAPKNTTGELIDIKALIRGADGGGFTLDEILSEYGVEPPDGQAGGGDLPWPQAPRRPRNTGNVVAFPGAPAQELEDAPEEEPEEAVPEEPVPDPEAENPEEPEETGGQTGQIGKVIEFPEEESVLTSFLKDLKGKADQYADQMFAASEEMDQEEIRRLEELIPGTDQEEAEEADIRFVRPRRRPDPPPPDLPARELSRQYSKGLKGLRLRGLLVDLLAILSVAMLLVPVLELSWTPPLDQEPVRALVCAGLLALGMLLGIDVLVQTLLRCARLRLGMDTITLLACCSALVDGVQLALHSDRGGQMPYCGVALAALAMLMHGEYHKRCGLRLSCRTAAMAAEPYLVTLEEGKWNSKDTYAKWSGVPDGFGSQIQMDDGAQRMFRRVCPVLIIGCVVLSLHASVGLEKPEHLLWCLSACFTACAALGGSVAYGRPFHKIARRLAQSGGALAGWPGVSASRRGKQVLLTDWDLFPPGSVEMNGIKVFGDFPVERVVGYTATLIRDSGSGLEKLFHNLLRSQGAIFRRAEKLCCYEGGGLSALIRGDSVLVGSAAFMRLMDVELPQGLNVKNAVFCAIDGELAGIFALNYALPDTVFPAFASLLAEKISPVLATRDFNVIPAMLQQRFKLAADRMEFPPIQRRRDLSSLDQEHEGILTAVLCREGLAPLAEAVVGCKRLRLATRIGAVLCCVGSTLGLLLSYYLTSVDAYASISPLNLLIFLVMWLFPVWFFTDWAPRY